MELSRWLAMPQQVETHVARWGREYPNVLTVDSITQHTGHRVFALTVGENAKLPNKLPGKAAFFCVPHAHEPAGTAAIMDVIHQLLTGKNLAGQPASFDYRAARERLILTFNPDANPGGGAGQRVVRRVVMRAASIDTLDVLSTLCGRGTVRRERSGWPDLALRPSAAGRRWCRRPRRAWAAGRCASPAAGWGR